MRRFRDLQQVRDDIKAIMPLDDFISMVDGKQLDRVNDELYKKHCDLDEHPADDDGSRDSTPSFTVAPHKELWYCFGCGTSGDRFEYISRKKKVDHIEAIHMAASMCNFDLTPYYEDQSPEDMMRDGLFKENDQARKIAHGKLLDTYGALDYLLGRGISMESIEKFELGYAPELTNGQVVIFNGIPNATTLKLDRKDQFNDAILFPVCDVYGRMRYFQSRPFHPLTGQKYLGASDSHPLYEETDRLYGFHIARHNLRISNGRMVIVEGAPDTIVMNQHGIPTAGVLGTALNEKIMALLDKFRVTEVPLILDGDKAGRDRTFKICEKYLSWKTNVRLRVVSLPEELDPDEFINKYGADEMRKLIGNAPYAIQYLLDAKWEEMQPDNPTAKITYMAEIAKYINVVTDKFTRKILLGHVSTKLGIDPVEVEDYYLSTAVAQEANLYNPDGEEILLAEAIRNPEFAVDLITRFKKEDWYLTRHRCLFELIKGAKHTDIDSLVILAANAGISHLVTREWLSRLNDKRGNVEFSLDDVADKLVRRKTKEHIAKMQAGLNDMSQQASQIIDRAIGEMYNATIRQADEMISDGSQQVGKTMKLLHERMKNPGQIIGYDLGPNFKRLTRAMLGAQTKTLTVVSANQSVGKTQIVENWVMHQVTEAIEKVPTLWFSLEMDDVRMTFRNLSILSGVPLTPLQTGNITVEDKIKLVDPWAAKLDNAPFYICERGHDLAEALAIARRYVMLHNVKQIVVDYIQLQYVSGRYGLERHRELGVISKAWKQFAKEMDVHVIGISQLSKEALQADVAKAEHGAGSYEVAQDADTYITLKEKDEEEISQNGVERGNLTLNLDKNRMGEADVMLNIYSDRAVQRMMEV